ncbi:YraN family protein [candidate division WOR-3 bacterium]|nr:YraN family protein [candidate division WOR-3 bacterium]
MAPVRFIGRRFDRYQNYRDEGERLAVNYLMNKGYRILERNYRVGKLEVDLIIEKGGVIVFVEVKRRKSEDFGSPAEFVNKKKQERIIKAAKVFLQRRKDFQDMDVRFDVVSVLCNTIDHIESAFVEVKQ